MRRAATVLDLSPYQIRRVPDGEGCTLYTAARIVAAFGGEITYEDLLGPAERKSLRRYSRSFVKSPPTRSRSGSGTRRRRERRPKAKKDQGSPGARRRKSAKPQAKGKARAPENRRLAISISPEFVFDILEGGKKVEYRSQPTNVRGRVWLYATRPFKRILGSVEIVDCRYLEKEDCYGYMLKNPEREVPSLIPTNRAQPRFWYPWKPGEKPIRNTWEEEDAFARWLEESEG
ncbi:MAG: ASCH domain-containing protein [Planctomycetota bacterium]